MTSEPVRGETMKIPEKAQLPLKLDVYKAIG